MALKVYGVAGSPATIRVMGTLLEKDLDFELVTVSFAAKENKSDQFLSRNPFGQVPAFEDGDLKLFESRAINHYIAQTYADKGTDLIMKDPKKLAIQMVWMDVEAHRFDRPASMLTWELCLKALFGKSTDEAVVTEFETKLSQVLDVYETRLTQSKYLAGDCFTLADLHHVPHLYYLMGTKLKSLFDARPHVGAWAADILCRPAIVKLSSKITNTVP